MNRKKGRTVSTIAIVMRYVYTLPVVQAQVILIDHVSVYEPHIYSARRAVEG